MNRVSPDAYRTKGGSALSLLTLSHVTKRYRIVGETSLFAREFTAVDDVSLTLPKGMTFGIVGESGCGKSTMARLMMGLEKPTAGEILFDGGRVDNLSERARRPLRPRFPMVFQDSGSSLNPRKSVRALLTDPMRCHGMSDADARARELMGLVGLPGAMLARYPHELSGGQRQRVCIARALALKPDLVVLDEPVSALDVSVQAQILNLIRDLQKELGLTCAFIGHGLSAVRYVSHRIAVMYLGCIVEQGTAAQVFDHPAHPYTRALIDAAPSADYDQRGRRRLALVGEIDEAPPKGGCPLYHRCPYASEACKTTRGELSAVPGDEGHTSACLKALAG